MNRIHPLIESAWKQRRGYATYDQCKKAWALFIANGFEARWIDDLTQAEATRLIARLLQIQELKKS